MSDDFWQRVRAYAREIDPDGSAAREAAEDDASPVTRLLCPRRRPPVLRLLSTPALRRGAPWPDGEPR